MNVDMEYDYAEALKRQGHKQADVDALRNIVQKFSIVPKSITNKQVKCVISYPLTSANRRDAICSSSQILLFLDSCGGVDEGAKTMKIYYEHKQKTPEHFVNRDPGLPKIEQCLQHQDYFFLPNTPRGDLVVFHRLSSSKSGDYHFDEAIKTFFMTIGDYRDTKSSF